MSGDASREGIGRVPAAEVVRRAFEVNRLTERGLTARAIAAKLGLSTRTVERYRKRTGVKGPAPYLPDATKARRARVAQAYRAGASIAVLAVQHDVSVSTIRRDLAALGVPGRRSAWARRFRPDGTNTTRRAS